MKQLSRWGSILLGRRVKQSKLKSRFQNANLMSSNRVSPINFKMKILDKVINSKHLQQLQTVAGYIQ